MAGSQTSRIFDHLGTAGVRVRRFVAQIRAGLDALYRAQFDEPWTRSHRPTYEEWQDYMAPRPREPRAKRETRHEAGPTFAARPVSRC